MQYLIGVDIGTQGTKTTICDENGMPVADAFEESKLYYPEHGACHQDPEEMLGSVLNTIKTVMDKTGIAPKDVACIGVDGQMAGIMAIGEDGKNITPYDSWLDTRCGKYRDVFLHYGERDVIQLTGAPVTYAHGPKIIWWMKEHPEVYAKIAKFLPPSPYCIMRMCGLKAEDAYIDYTYLHFSGFSDTKNKTWSEDLLHATGVSADKMPRILRPYDVVGELTQEFADACGLLKGTPMVAGCGDTAGSSFGAGLVRPGLVLDVAGTASAFICSATQYAPDVQHKTIMFAPSVIEGLYTPMAYINGGGMCLRWYRDDILESKYTYDELNAMAEHVPPGSEKLIFLPHFSGRVCPNDTLVRGSYVNLSWVHKTEHMYRAILEGITYEYGIYKDIVAELIPDQKFDTVLGAGGGSKSPFFNQMKADMLRMPYKTINIADTAALGCCVIAGYGTGVYSSLTEPLGRALKFSDGIQPNPANYETYRHMKDVYADMFDALHGIYAKI